MIDLMITLIVIIMLIYFIDQIYIGFFPDMLKPLQLWRQLRKRRMELLSNPHSTSIKLEVVRILIERKQFKDARKELLQMDAVIHESVGALYDLGFCQLKLGEIEDGERLMEQAMKINPRVRYGEAYLRLAEAFGNKNTSKALEYMKQFKSMQSSSCEAYFRLGMLYEKLNRKQEAKQAYQETFQIYRSLPKYKKKMERKWVILAGWRR